MGFDLAEIRSRSLEPQVSDFVAREATPAGVRTEVLSAPASQSEGQDAARTLLYLHGGGYITGYPANYRGATVPLARATAARTYVPDYRLAPEHPFPSSFEDCLAVYRWLVTDGGVDPAALALAGDSAGGAMVASVLAAARDEGLPLAACGVINSAYADLAAASPSLDDPARNQGRQTKAYVRWIMDTYLDANDADPRDPRHSPVYADLSGLPPLLVQMGGLDNLHDDGLRLAERASECGVSVTTSEYPDSAHIWVVRGTNPPDPEAVRAVAEAAAFILAHTG